MKTIFVLNTLYNTWSKLNRPIIILNKMKLLNKIWGIGLIAMSIALITPKHSMAQDGGYVTDQEFYDNLQPYGTWVSDDQYGNVWVPDVDEGFRPYATRGHWVVTDYGNT